MKADEPIARAERNRQINKKILTFGCLPITIILALVIIAAVVGSNSTEEDAKNQKVTVDEDKAREAAGLPPEPDAATRQAFLDALNTIDPRIIKPGKEDQAVSRGLNQCSSSSSKGREQIVQQALARFTVTTRLPEIATPETGEKILDAVHAHLCPDLKG
ncbi:hypothetical protein [Streptomyces pacificus]|uniref:DUF732 domain-containing protein n=1 Tax=Streptomyces pacificus TaxID=2705029 RepID=A0A6A0B2Z9_9ACTN|nr:hypothetical protein [Streptomyces pacificus]GFH38898.1 hypothetical protein SCWH03_51610 [Streptomyces pacificus]